MEKNTNDKQIANMLRRLGNYECENQMSIFDVDWNSIHKESTSNDRSEDELVLNM